MASRERWLRAVSRAFQSVENTSSMAPGPKICRRNWITEERGKDIWTRKNKPRYETRGDEGKLGETEGN